jgi:DEAD/DEAH box helicase domain-containing protein
METVTSVKIQDINEYIVSLKGSPRLSDQVVFHTILPEKKANLVDLKNDWSQIIASLLKNAGISKLYRHQLDAIDLVRNGHHVIISTPTASGKTLIYNLPVLESVFKNSSSRALYLFPLKALAQDQLKALKNLSYGLEGDDTCKAQIYDGDTPTWHRKKIRSDPPNVLISNPDMLHLSLLPYHRSWQKFFSDLKIVVVDEVHTYRGVMGSHMAQVFRRFLRICNLYGTAPTFIFSSATVSNPAQLANQLTGLFVHSIDENSAAKSPRHMVFIDPVDSPSHTAILLLKAALHRKLRTIVYTQSRKMAELIAIWAGSQSGPFAQLVSPYRAGFLAEERREIERKLTSGELLAVISTSALELGIDIGDLDLCLLVGYPGSVVATWQRAGRVGRSGQDSAVIMIGGQDALDQYFLRNPHEFLTRDPEAAVLNPFNPDILKSHIVCAAAEHPLTIGEPYISEKPVSRVVASLVDNGKLLNSADGQEFHAMERYPHRHVSLRGGGKRYSIVSSVTGENLGEIDGIRAFKETHPGAVYIHRGDIFLVNHMDLTTKTVKISQANLGYYTRVRTNKTTEILETYDEKRVRGTSFFTGRLKVTEQVTGYEKLSIHGRKKLNIIPLDLPPLIFETDGVWFIISPKVQESVDARQMHFMGGIHAIEHTAIGCFPLLVMADRNDLGGISIPFHPQVQFPSIFIYDGHPGGAGLCRLAFDRAKTLLQLTYDTIVECACENGCPSCVHSPKCGSGNRPIDKPAARFILEKLLQKQKDTQNYRFTPAPALTNEKVGKPSHQKLIRGVGVFDLETQYSAQEVGGWNNADQMKVSCAVLFDTKSDKFLTFTEDQLPTLIDHLINLDLIVGFNIKRFDYKVLSGYTTQNLQSLPTLDLLESIHQYLGFRLSLDHLAAVTLGTKKSADGLQALKWWQQGRIDDIIAYCKDDVKITRDLYLFGKKNGYVLFKNKAEKTVRVPVKW